MCFRNPGGYRVKGIYVLGPLQPGVLPTVVSPGGHFTEIGAGFPSWGELKKRKIKHAKAVKHPRVPHVRQRAPEAGEAKIRHTRCRGENLV
jgi:hypothetical protein